MDSEIAIARHGLIGDLQTAALVGDEGTIDWYCCPRFDSPSVFAALLDNAHGGHFRIAPEGRSFTSSQLYLPGTAVLITRFRTSEGVSEVLDFMPVTSTTATPVHQIVRVMRCVSGRAQFRIDCEPRFDYGRQDHELELSPGAALFRTADLSMALYAGPRSSQPTGEPLNFDRRGDGVTAVVGLKAGELSGVVLLSGTDRPLPPLAPGEVMEDYLNTVNFWRTWLAHSRYRGRWREAVERSAITLKLLTYAPTGAFVAAPTAGLPEQVGGERNWDYRYTWIRDASFSAYALLGLGFSEEARALGHWLGDRVRELSEGEEPLNIMYRVDGSSDLFEETLPHLKGYRESRPVRIGNAASGQRQLDIYGELMDALYLADASGIRFAHQGWLKIVHLIDWVCDHWDEPEEGIWETRGGRQDFVYGRFQAWIALDRAVRLAQRHARPADLGRWVAERDRIYQQVMSRGWDPERKAFVQHYGSKVLDASLLLMPVSGFLVPDDPLWLSTLEAMGQELVSDSLVYRYDPSASPDGLRGSEGTFSMCSFWYVDALARSGYLDEARLAFEKMLTYSNHVGLYSEEISSNGEQIGNFPQAFTHLALITSAMNLDFQLDHGAGTVDLVRDSRG